MLLDYIFGIPDISYLVIIAEMFCCLPYARHPPIIYIYTLVSFLGIVIAFFWGGGAVEDRGDISTYPVLCIKWQSPDSKLLSAEL